MTIKVLFVCLGNICRSPLAQGVFEQVSRQMNVEARFTVDSAGTSNWHIGEPPDPRSIETASRHGIDISAQKCRQLNGFDFTNNDFIFAMDQNNLAKINSGAPIDTTEKVHLLLGFSGMGNGDIPDPYYGGQGEFEAVYQLLDGASRNIINRLIA